jgi:hypothetical protein
MLFFLSFSLTNSFIHSQKGSKKPLVAVTRGFLEFRNRSSLADNTC